MAKRAGVLVAGSVTVNASPYALMVGFVVGVIVVGVMAVIGYCEGMHFIGLDAEW